LTARARAREQAVAFTGTRPLSEVLEHNRVMRAAKAASLAEPAADCLYAVADGQVITIPIARRTPKQVKFRFANWRSDEIWEHTVDRDRLEREGCVQYGYLPETITGHCLYATPGLAEALLGEPLPPLNVPDWRDEHDKARDERRTMRAWYEMLHEDVDLLNGWDKCTAQGGLCSFLTAEEAAVIHDRIDAGVKADGYWDDDLPAQWWRAR
jgi:hypothetical protein